MVISISNHCLLNKVSMVFVKLLMHFLFSIFVSFWARNVIRISPEFDIFPYIKSKYLQTKILRMKILETFYNPKYKYNDPIAGINVDNWQYSLLLHSQNIKTASQGISPAINNTLQWCCSAWPRVKLNTKIDFTPPPPTTTTTHHTNS